MLAIHKPKTFGLRGIFNNSSVYVLKVYGMNVALLCIARFPIETAITYQLHDVDEIFLFIGYREVAFQGEVGA